MAYNSVFCILASQKEATAVLNELSQEGFSMDDISILFSDKMGPRDFVHEKHTKAPESALAGATTGGFLGGAVGWLTGIGSLVIPGLGAIAGAGPILGGLSGMAVGATVGAITGGLLGLGIPEYQARQYEGKIKAGNILVSVHTETVQQERMVKNIFQKAHCQDVSISQEIAVY